MRDNHYRYAGYQYDHETGLYYLIARYYQPKHGVFLTLDPNPWDSDDIQIQNGIHMLIIIFQIILALTVKEPYVNVDVKSTVLLCIKQNQN
ncbi:RHS repeat-associated core domain-containing protein [Neobacillus notoginsengisoli]|uniref:RHS repeat-associated core domain-containing protein n=1 Tax=Neobacillus notoginsengisoli TaxID=1578198 RepID=UPI0026BFAA3C